MVLKLKTFQKIALKVFYFYGILFGFLPFKFSKSLNAIAESKKNLTYNRVLISVMVINFAIVLSKSLKIVLNDFSNTKAVVNASINTVYFLVTVCSYIFINCNRYQILNILNHFMKFSLVLVQNDFSLPLVLSFQGLFLYPILHVYHCALAVSLVYLDFSENFSYAVMYVFIFPSRLIAVFICCVLNFHSLILKKASESEQISNNHEHIFEILQLTRTICKLFNSYILGCVAFYYFSILVQCFGMCSLALIIAMKISSIFDPFLILPIYTFGLFVEIFNLWLLLRTCKTFKSNVS